MTARHAWLGILGLVSLLVLTSVTLAAAPRRGPTRGEKPPAQHLTSSPPSAAELATAQTDVQHMLSSAMTEGGMPQGEAILTAKHRIEALQLTSRIDRPARKQARADNARGLDYLRNGQGAEAVQALQAAAQADPADVEIANNLGYAYLRSGDVRAAEQALLRTLVLAPGRTSAWANLGQTYAQQGNHRAAVACFANAYRFSTNPEMTRQFLEKLAEENTVGVREAAHQALQLRLIQAGTGQDRDGDPQRMAERPAPHLRTSQSLDTVPPPSGESSPAPAPPCSASPEASGLTARGENQRMSPPQETMAPLQWRFTYDEAGRVTSVADPAGRTTVLHRAFDSQGRLRCLKRITPDGTQVATAFDQFGRRVQMQDALGTVEYDYDGFSRLVAVRRHGVPALTYTYDTHDRLSSLKVGDAYTLQYAYDFLGRVVAIDTPLGRLTYAYKTGEGKTIQTLPNGVRTIWAFHPNNSLASITHVGKDDAVLMQFTYAYRPDGLMSESTERSPQSNKTFRHTYDGVQRLIAVEDAHAGTTTYRYSQLGDRLAVTPPHVSEVTSAYDWAGRLITHDGQACIHDAVGNLKSCGTALAGRVLGYNASHQPTSATSALGDVYYQYDGEGYLVERTVDGQVTRYVPDPLVDRWHPLAAIESSGQATYWLWAGDAPVASLTREGGHFFLHDHLGSVRLMVDKLGTITETLAYTPFGEPQPSRHAERPFPGFAGMLFDPHTLLYLTRARVYDPSLGRFLQRDPRMVVPTGFQQQDLSAYAYAANDPVNFVDRNGAQSQRADAGNPEDFRRWPTDEQTYQKRVLNYLHQALSDLGVQKGEEIGIVLLGVNHRFEDARKWTADNFAKGDKTILVPTYGYWGEWDREGSDLPKKATIPLIGWEVEPRKYADLLQTLDDKVRTSVPLGYGQE